MTSYFFVVKLFFNWQFQISIRTDFTLGIFIMETQVLTINPENIEYRQIQIAAEALQNDKVIVFPTETVYGLGCSVDSDIAVERIYEMKKRDRRQPLAICLASVDDIANYQPELSPAARKIIEHFLPGSVTVLLRCGAGRILGFRVPDYEITRMLISCTGTALYATSVNISGGRDLTTAEEILAKFGDRLDVLVDSGPSKMGVASTIIDLSTAEPILIREGAITHSEIEDVISEKLLKRT